MKTLSILILSFTLIIIVRLIFRKKLDLPKYSGKMLADESGFDNLMPESAFWQIIHDARKSSKSNYQVECQLMVNILQSFSEEEIIRFNRTFVTLMAKSYSFKLWEAAYALNGGCSDDCFEYFRSWLIGQGKNKFYWTLKYPRLLFLIGVKEMIENYEGLTYCAYEAYQSKSGRELPSYSDIIYTSEGRIFNESLVALRYPELVFLAW